MVGGAMGVRKGRLARLAKLGGMAAGLATDAAGAGARLATSKVSEASARFHERAAHRLAAQLGEMKGLPLKVGQLLSYVDDAIPAEHRIIYRKVLGRLQAHSVHVPYEEMRALMIEELGGPPEEVFAAFDPEPIAAASIGQVYRARLDDGTHVAVKVQYPGIADAIRSDLANAGFLVTAMETVLPRTDLQLFLEEVTARIGEECDYRIEAEHQEAFRAHWAEDPDVVIPRVVPEHSSERVLVSEFLDAMDWEAAQEADAELKRRWGRVIFRFVFHSLYLQGVFNADPHPGNYLFFPDGRVAFLDFGCVQRYDPASLEAFRAVRAATVRGESGPAYSALVRDMLMLPEAIDPELQDLLEAYLRLSFEPVAAPQPYRYTRDYTERLTRYGMDAKAVFARKALRHGVPPVRRQGLVFITRINFGLASILATLGAEDDWNAIMGPVDGS